MNWVCLILLIEYFLSYCMVLELCSAILKSKGLFGILLGSKCLFLKLMSTSNLATFIVFVNEKIGSKKDTKQALKVVCFYELIM